MTPERLPDTERIQPRAAAYGLVVGGLMAGLPTPMMVQAYQHQSLVLVMDDGDRSAVDAWAAYLGLPTPTLLARVIEAGYRRWRSYTSMDAHPGLPGWQVQVYCTVTLTDTPIPAAASDQPLTPERLPDTERIQPNPADLDYSVRGYCADHGGYLGRCLHCPQPEAAPIEVDEVDEVDAVLVDPQTVAWAVMTARLEQQRRERQARRAAGEVGHRYAEPPTDAGRAVLAAAEGGAA